MKPFNHHFGFVLLYDSRIYKDAESFDKEYYLRDFSGNEIGVFNHASSEWTWYIHGDNRFAKYTPLSDQQSGITVSSSVPSVNFLTHSNVRIDEMTYYVFDHLGNTRLNYTVSVDNCDVDEELQLADIDYTLNYVGDYFPFGKILRQYVPQNGGTEKYLTTHNERDSETELDYRNARYYDSDIGRFLGVDALSMEAPNWNPYRYAFSNPIAFIDPTGLFEDNYITDENGVLVEIQETGDNNHRLFVGDQELFLNDPKLDSRILQNFNVGDQLIHTISFGGLQWMMETSSIPNVPDGQLKRFTWDFFAEIPAKSYSTMDFGAQYLLPPQNLSEFGPGDVRAADVNGLFFRFEGTNDIAFNTNDAAQAIWGHAMYKYGYSHNVAMNGAQLNEGWGDSFADQRAIHFGHSLRIPSGTEAKHQSFLHIPAWSK